MQARFPVSWFTLLVASFLAAPAFGCLWDYDTLQMERQRFPRALELITGKFLRHSPTFYRWRVTDRKRRLQQDSSDVRLYDDLAVAYDKLGQHDKAIETILKAKALEPNRYETHANLGTFLIHAGKLKEGLKHIKRAIAINPNAHFGREVYQKLLVEYVLSRQQDGKTVLPLRDQPSEELELGGFDQFVLKAQGVEGDSAKQVAELRKATQGVLGMMRFGKHDSPILLEALGDLLCFLDGYQAKADAKRLAARAYLKAAHECADSEVKKKYYELSAEALALQTVRRSSRDEEKLAHVERVFQQELKEAERWYQVVERDEKRWLASGKNPEEEYSRKYYDEPSIESEEPAGFSYWVVVWWVMGGICCLTLGLVIYGWRASKRRQIALTTKPTGSLDER